MLEKKKAKKNKSIVRIKAKGNTPKISWKSVYRTEYEDCVLLATYLDNLKKQGKLLRYTHIPNETFTRNWGTKMKNKRQGVRAGFPDYFILFHHKAVCIEMKRLKPKGVIKPEQEEWIIDLNKLGIDTIACWGYDEAVEVINKYISVEYDFSPDPELSTTIL